MDDIDIPGGWRNQLDTLVTRRGALAAAAVVGVVVAFLVFAGGNKAPARIAPPAVSTAGGAAEPSPAGTLLVHVAGAVRMPGVYELEPGARVADAITAAGGPLKAAALDLLNLAQLVADGMKVDVPKEGQATGVPTPGASPAESGAPIAINSADQSALEAIPGIGPVRAAAILAYRDERGGFTALEELLDVSGIGPATFESILPYVTL